MSFLERQCKRVSNKLTRARIARLGDRWTGVTVSEYPKAGGTWLGKMIADALQLPYPAPAVFPVAFPAVVHNHWTWDPRFRRVVYLRRDGRDVMVSYFFHRMRRLERGDPATVASHARVYDRLFGPGYDPADTRGLLPRFIEHEFAHPRGARLNWRQHVEAWWGRPHVAQVSYEELLADAATTLGRVIEDATGARPDEWQLATTAEKFSMSRQTGGRRQGQEDRSSFIRKGVAGDWRNHFTREAAEVFDRLAGDALVELGYEPDRGWVRTVDDGAAADASTPGAAQSVAASPRG